MRARLRELAGATIGKTHIGTRIGGPIDIGATQVHAGHLKVVSVGGAHDGTSGVTRGARVGAVHHKVGDLGVPTKVADKARRPLSLRAHAGDRLARAIKGAREAGNGRPVEALHVTGAVLASGQVERGGQRDVRGRASGQRARSREVANIGELLGRGNLPGATVISGQVAKEDLGVPHHDGGRSLCHHLADDGPVGHLHRLPHRIQADVLSLDPVLGKVPVGVALIGRPTQELVARHRSWRHGAKVRAVGHGLRRGRGAVAVGVKVGRVGVAVVEDVDDRRAAGLYLLLRKGAHREARDGVRLGCRHGAHHGLEGLLAAGLLGIVRAHGYKRAFDLLVGDGLVRSGDGGLLLVEALGPVTHRVGGVTRRGPHGRERHVVLVQGPGREPFALVVRELLGRAAREGAPVAAEYVGVVHRHVDRLGCLAVAHLDGLRRARAVRVVKDDVVGLGGPVGVDGRHGGRHRVGGKVAGLLAVRVVGPAVDGVAHGTDLRGLGLRDQRVKGNLGGLGDGAVPVCVVDRGEGVAQVVDVDDGGTVAGHDLLLKVLGGKAVVARGLGLGHEAGGARLVVRLVQVKAGVVMVGAHDVRALVVQALQVVVDHVGRCGVRTQIGREQHRGGPGTVNRWLVGAVRAQALGRGLAAVGNRLRVPSVQGKARGGGHVRALCLGRREAAGNALGGGVRRAARRGREVGGHRVGNVAGAVQDDVDGLGHCRAVGPVRARDVQGERDGKVAHLVIGSGIAQAAVVELYAREVGLLDVVHPRAHVQHLHDGVTRDGLAGRKGCLSLGDLQGGGVAQVDAIPADALSAPANLAQADVLVLARREVVGARGCIWVVLAPDGNLLGPVREPAHALVDPALADHDVALGGVHSVVVVTGVRVVQAVDVVAALGRVPTHALVAPARGDRGVTLAHVGGIEVLARERVVQAVHGVGLVRSHGRLGRDGDTHDNADSQGQHAHKLLESRHGIPPSFSVLANFKG